MADAIIPLWASLARLDAVPKLAGAGFAGAFLPATSLFETGLLARSAEISRRSLAKSLFPWTSHSGGSRKFQDCDQATVQRGSKFLLSASAALERRNSRSDGLRKYGLNGRLARPLGVPQKAGF